MELKDIEIGMKVRLLGKHGLVDNFDNINDWYECGKNSYAVQEIQKQGYGIVVHINKNNVTITNNKNNDNSYNWLFLPSDLEPYEEEQNQQKNNTKSPKEWLLTPMAVCTTRSGDKFVTLSNERSPMLEYEDNWSNNLEREYDENLSYIFEYQNSESSSDIVKIEYNGEVVWEKYYTLLEAIRTCKKIKYKNWNNYLDAQEVLNWVYVQQKEFLIEIINEVVWQVKE